MLDGVPLQLLAQAGGPAAGWLLAVISCWFVLTGRLVPRRVLEDQQEATATWRAAYEAERARADRVIEPSAQLQRQVLTSLPAPANSVASLPAPSSEGDSS